MQHHPSKYRPDIDGLRAVAVMAVIAYHLHFQQMLGGYVGVDVFFVISGYLISGILLKDIRASRFSLAGFYERRCRRILPALFVVTFVTVVLGYFYLLPAEMVDYSKALISSVFSASNFYFATKAGYFGSTGPLLHTWSLAVEEQFYIAFPLLLVLVHRYKRAWLNGTILLIGGVSLLISAVGAYKFQTQTFYMPYTRAWELLLGAVLSLQMLPAIRHRILREGLAALGLVLIAFSIHMYSDATPFPGLAAVPPCLGAALILFAGESGSSLTSALLSIAPMTFLGSISYSLYLWHWPLIIFGQRGFLTFNALSHRWNVLIFLAICIGLATLSWRFVELPARFGRLRIPRTRLFVTVAVVIAAFACVGGSLIALHGLPSRFPTAALAIAQNYDQKSNTEHFRSGSCFLVSPEPFSHFNPASCLQLDPSRTNYLLLGDSHAAALWHALSVQIPQANVLQATASNCKPFQGQGSGTVCGELMTYVYEQFLKDHRVDAIIITARWKERDLPEIAAMARWSASRGVPLIVIGPAEEYDAPLPILLAYAIRSNDPELAYTHRVTHIEALDKAMQRAAETQWHVPYVSLVQALCVPGSCHEYVDPAKTIPTLFDHDHYTDEGSAFVVKKLVSEGAFKVAKDTTAPSPGRSAAGL